MNTIPHKESSGPDEINMPPPSCGNRVEESFFFIDSLMVRIYSIIVMIRWTGLAPWEFEFPFSGSRTSRWNTTHQPIPDYQHFQHQPTGVPRS